MALVDSEATHNFVLTKEAARLGLKLSLKMTASSKPQIAKHKRRMVWRRTWQFRFLLMSQGSLVAALEWTVDHG